jgi:hypothetical protein
MSMNYKNLDARTRTLMMQEVELDISNGRLYFSKRFTPKGVQLYPKLLLEAVRLYDDDWLANELNTQGCFSMGEVKHIKTGNITVAHTPFTAGETLAEGEFNRFYMRGVCLRAMEDGVSEVIVYRGKAVVQQRPESQALIGKKIPASLLLEDLRCPLGAKTKYGLPSGPNSGITIGLN